METTSGSDPEKPVTYSLRWPASLAEAVAKAATGRTMSMAVWLRQAVLEKLDRDRGEKP